MPHRRNREKSLVLDVGFEPEERRWDLIVKYSGSLQGALNPEIKAVELLGGFAILSVPENQIDSLSEYPQIEFIEMPKRLFFAVEQGRAASCINPVQSGFSPLGQPLLGQVFLWAVWIPGWIMPIRISAMQTGAAVS